MKVRPIDTYVYLPVVRDIKIYPQEYEEVLLPANEWEAETVFGYMYFTDVERAVNAARGRFHGTFR